MSRLPIFFFSEGISYTLKQKTLVRNWIYQTIKSEGRLLKELNFIFCSDEYLLGINQQYLSHDTYTDIITFDNSENKNLIKGDIFISIDRIRENALKYQVSEKDELHRIMIHGTLHLLRYKDKTKKDKVLMTQKEDQHLALRNF